MRNLDRFGDPFSSRPRDPFVRQSIERERHPAAFGHPPVITLNGPSEQQRRSFPPRERPDAYGRMVRLSETPPARASGNRIDPFRDVFGGCGRPGKFYRERDIHS